MLFKVYQWRTVLLAKYYYDLLNRRKACNDKDLHWDAWSIKIVYEH